MGRGRASEGGPSRNSDVGFSYSPFPRVPLTRWKQHISFSLPPPPRLTAPNVGSEVRYLLHKTFWMFYKCIFVLCLLTFPSNNYKTTPPWMLRCCSSVALPLRSAPVSHESFNFIIRYFIIQSAPKKLEEQT